MEKEKQYGKERVKDGEREVIWKKYRRKEKGLEQLNRAARLCGVNGLFMSISREAPENRVRERAIENEREKVEKIIKYSEIYRNGGIIFLMKTSLLHR